MLNSQTDRFCHPEIVSGSNKCGTHVIARHESASVKIIACSKQSDPPLGEGKIASKCSIIDRVKSLMTRNDVKSGKFYSLFTISCSPRVAFTLAEVLITLGIVGMVAEMTIPTLIQNVQKQVYVTQLKKFYSNFNQALITIANDGGCPGDLKCTGLFTGTADSAKLNEIGDAIVPFFKILKNCKNTASSDCFPDAVNNKYDGTGTWATAVANSADVYYRFVTADGVSVAIAYGDAYSDCAYSNGTGPNSSVCAQVRVDVNGRKPPNFHGRDNFGFYITNGKGPQLAPVGWSYDNAYWKTRDGGVCQPSNPAGGWCTGRIIEESWEMNY